MKAFLVILVVVAGLAAAWFFGWRPHPVMPPAPVVQVKRALGIAVPTPHPAVAAQAEALRRYPALALPNSVMNYGFLQRVAEAKQYEPELMAKSDWPLILAQQVAAAVVGKPAAAQPKEPLRDEDLWTAPDGLNHTIIGRVRSNQDGGVELQNAVVTYPGMVDEVLYTNPLSREKRTRKVPGTKTESYEGSVFLHGAGIQVRGTYFEARVCPVSDTAIRTSDGYSYMVKAFSTQKPVGRR